MPSAQSRIQTDRAGRYLAQLCQHLNQIGHHARPAGAAGSDGAARIRRVDWTDSHGVIEFTSGTCTLDASNAELVITLAAVDPNALRYMQEMFAARLTTIGRRDNLVITW